jgi:hypothetical protein
MVAWASQPTASWVMPSTRASLTVLPPLLPHDYRREQERLISLLTNPYNGAANDFRNVPLYHNFRRQQRPRPLGNAIEWESGTVSVACVSICSIAIGYVSHNCLITPTGGILRSPHSSMDVSSGIIKSPYSTILIQWHGSLLFSGEARSCFHDSSGHTRDFMPTVLISSRMDKLYADHRYHCPYTVLTD